MAWLLCTGVLWQNAFAGTVPTGAPGGRSPELKAETAQSDTSPGPPGPAGEGRSEAEARPQGSPPADNEVAALKERIIEFQNKGKLGFRKIVPCTAVEGFGVYSPLEPQSKASKIVLYVEPMNFTTLITKDRYIVDLSVDIFAYDLSGKLLVGKENVLRINRVSRSPIVDLYYKIELNLAKHTGQDFVIKTSLHDKLKNQSASTIHRIKTSRTGKSPAEGI